MGAQLGYPRQTSSIGRPTQSRWASIGRPAQLLLPPPRASSVDHSMRGQRLGHGRAGEPQGRGRLGPSHSAQGRQVALLTPIPASQLEQPLVPRRARLPTTQDPETCPLPGTGRWALTAAPQTVPAPRRQRPTG